MPAGGGVEVKSTPPDEQRRKDVLKAARQVFEAEGLDGASIRMIAQAAGMTTGAIYPYFRGKEEIYAELLSQSLEAYRRKLVAEVAKAPNPESRFAAALVAHFNHYEKRASDMSLALYLFNGLKPQGLTKELDARLNAQLADILAVFRESVQSLARCSEREAEIEVGLHYAMLFGLLLLVHTRRTRVFRVDARALLELHVRQAVERLTPARAARKSRAAPATLNGGTP